MFSEGYRECVLLSRVELEKEESYDNITAIEDEVTPHFAGALTVCVPKGIDKLSNIR